MASGQFLVLVRHGESEANANLARTTNELYYSLSGSDPAIALTKTGHVQAAQAGKLLSQRFSGADRFHQLFCTHFARVQQTVDAIVSALSYELERTNDARLHKRNYGKFWNLTRKGVEVLHPEEYKAYLQAGDLAYRAPEGENYADVFARVDDFIATVLATGSANTLVVSHSVVLLAFQRAFEHISDQDVLSRYEANALSNAAILTYWRADLNSRWQRT